MALCIDGLVQKIEKEHLLVCRLAIDNLYKNCPEISKVDEITTDWLK